MSMQDPVAMLVVEDDLGDQKLLRSALNNLSMPVVFSVHDTAEEALDYLVSSKEEGGLPQPNLILLDLNMPGMGGREFLRRIKQDEELCPIPVVVLTTSDSQSDIEQCYKLHAAGYIQKPSTPAELREIMKRVAEYWFTNSPLVRL
ncbi:MAG TPA: response regulator [Sedimentisphaerales bacterium]|nr:response regulator [Sedimentisphaerales bacterium]